MYILDYIYTCAILRWHDYTYVSFHALGTPGMLPYWRISMFMCFGYITCASQ